MPKLASLPSLPAALWAARPTRHVVLVGPSCAGKSTVAPLVAQALGLRAADLDAAVVTRAGMSVADIFAQQGEAAFRALERACLQTLLRRRSPTVIAAGGGTWANAQARALLQQGALEVHLTVSPPEALRRLHTEAGAAARPLMAGDDPLAALTALARARQEAYAQCRLQVDTTGRCAKAVAQQVVRALSELVPHELLAEHAGATYPIDLCTEAAHGPARAAERATAFAQARRLALVGDRTVLALFGAAYQKAFEQKDLVVSVHAFDPGEASKSLQSAERLIASLAQAGISRQDVVVGLGGGVALDLAAFVAGIYLRGVPFVGVATTALAAIDASVGGKCGVNLGVCKNQLGLIRPPGAVVLDVAAILAQQAPDRLAGAVEAVKMGALFCAELMEAVPRARQDARAWHQLIAWAVALKIAVCRRDPEERGLRRTLNYGHTLGHAIEAGSNFAVPHGVAVALGMVAEAEFAEAHGLARGIVAPLTEALRAMNMPVDWRRATVQTDALRRDKKGDGHTVLLPVVSQPGRVALHAIPLGHLEQFVRKP